MNLKAKLIFFVVLFLMVQIFSACGKKTEVIGITQNTSTSVPEIKTSNETLCSEHTLIRPQVDLLILWDNSGSAVHINSETKNALRNTINQISPRFDYHIVLAPLVIDEANSSNNPPLFLILENTKDVSSAILNGTDAKVQLIPNDNLGRMDAFAAIANTAGKEKGIQRVLDIISNENTAKGVFRKNGYLLTILISNGNDSPELSHKAQSDELKNRYMTSLRALKASLESEQFRIISIVAHKDSKDYGNNCNALGADRGHVYIDISGMLYDELPTEAKDAQSNAYKDSYDLCQNAFTHLFDGPNQTIQDILIKHVYNHWRVVDTKDKNFDPKKIVATKNTGVALTENDPNGFKYVGYRENQNTRIKPTPGEPRTGHFIELLGSGMVTYPECLYIGTQENAEYYNYIVVNEAPNTDTVKITINGQDIPRSTSNGWNYEGYSPSKNIRVLSPTDLTEYTPGTFKSGYFIKMHGSAIYTNGSQVKIEYKRAPIT
ncbi:MAG: hypothetical protein HQK50_09555 [Oligoflexia bacterium]|nr:hypothetical protein [Oligoflexia bacterium]MBF0365807.1 hypothetical protein [Oligoflexia bacterium]